MESIGKADQKSRMQVLLVDDHAMVREALRTVLESYDDVEVVGEARDGFQAVNAADRLRPRVVVMDINMPQMNGIDATAHIKIRHPSTIVIGLSINASRENHAAMTKAGATMLLSKEAAVDQLYDAIVRTVEGSDAHVLKMSQYRPCSEEAV